MDDSNNDEMVGFQVATTNTNTYCPQLILAVPNLILDPAYGITCGSVFTVFKLPEKKHKITNSLSRIRIRDNISFGYASMCITRDNAFPSFAISGNLYVYIILPNYALFTAPMIHTNLSMSSSLGFVPRRSWTAAILFNRNPKLKAML